MTWGTNNWAGGGGSSGGGEMRVHGSDMHDATVPKIINPNLLYNSTGMMNLGGWINTDKVINFRDDFIIDDFSYFLMTGSTEGAGFSSYSLPLEPSTEYVFSGTFLAQNTLRMTMFFQKQEQLNDHTAKSGLAVLFEQLFAEELRVQKTFMTPADIVGGFLCIEHITSDTLAVAKLTRMKIEKGSTATEWIPCLTDPYQNTVSLGGMSAADIMRMQQGG
jgi:hypothetical protein